MDESTEDIVRGELDIKHGQLSEGKRDAVLKKKLKAENPQALKKYGWKYGKYGNLTM